MPTLSLLVKDKIFKGQQAKVLFDSLNPKEKREFFNIILKATSVNRSTVHRWMNSKSIPIYAVRAFNLAAQLITDVKLYNIPALDFTLQEAPE